GRDALERAQLDRQQLHVRDHADALNPAIAGDSVLGDGQLERDFAAVRGGLAQLLDRALAEARAAEDDPAIEVLERATDDLRSRGRALVDQRDDRRLHR